MGFLVIGIDRNTGAAVLLTETPLPTRQSAVEALKTLVATDASDLASYDVVIVDLDAGTPVVVLQTPQATASVLEPEAAEPLPLLRDTEPEEAVRAVSAPDDALSATASVLDHRAFTVDAGHPDEAVAFAPDAFAAVEEPPVAAAPEPEPVISEEQVPPHSADDEQGLLEALRRAADSLVQQGVEVPEVLDDDTSPAVEAPEPAPSEAAMPVAEPMGVVETLPSEPAPSSTDFASAEPAPSSTDFASVVEPVRPVIMGEYPEAVHSAEPELTEAQPYQPSGELEIAAYTCDDCVYSSTCPKAGESSPADCGTFQWRSF